MQVALEGLLNILQSSLREDEDGSRMQYGECLALFAKAHAPDRLRCGMRCSAAASPFTVACSQIGRWYDVYAWLKTHTHVVLANVPPGR